LWRKFSRALDVLAVLVILLAVYKFVIAPRDFGSFPVRPAPTVNLPAMTGGEFSLAQLRGKVVFVDFWASWCEPCQLSLPLVEHFASTHPDAVVIAIDAGESPDVARAFAQKHDLRNVVFDQQMKASDAFNVEGFPTLVVVDPRGMERAKWFGFNPAIESLMGAALDTFKKKSVAEAATPLTLAIDGDPNTLDPILNTPYGWQLAPLSQGYLFTVDERGRLVPDLALDVPTRANGGISADGRTIRYRLRAARWSDGAPFGAEDVAFTVRALLDPRTSVPDRSTVAQIARVNVEGPHALAIRLRAPNAPFVDSFLSLGANDPFAILPRHLLAGLGSLDRSPLDGRTVGLGPYRLRAWRRGETLTFERNPYYWRGAAPVAEVRVAIVPDAETRVLRLRNGELDLAYLSGLLVDQLRAANALALVEKTTNIIDYLQCNLRSAALQPVAVRRAIAAALDREKLSSAIYHGLEAPADGAAYDPVTARRLLAGRHVHLDLAVAGTWRSSASAAVEIASDLQRVGIETTIHSYSTSVFWGPRNEGGILDGGRYDLALTQWSPSLDPDRSYLFGCDARGSGGANSMNYCSAAFDRAQEAGLRSYDPLVRARAYRRAGEILANDLPVIPIGFERSAYGVSARLRNFKPNVLGRDFWNAWEWRLEG
jgi:peptide/nickel transport system substrate-binding protein